MVAMTLPDLPPLLILRLEHAHAVLTQHRIWMGLGVLLAGAGMAGPALWPQALAPLPLASPAGSPALGLLALIAGLLLSFAPVQRLAVWLHWHTRLEVRFLGQRELAWLDELGSRHPPLAPLIGPALQSRHPVPVEFLKVVWLRLKQLESQG